MFTLRSIEEKKEDDYSFEQVTSNHYLGKSYTRLVNGMTTEFDAVMKEQFPHVNKNSIESIICSDLGDIFFIEKSEKNKIYSYYIMTENGRTFEKIY